MFGGHNQIRSRSPRFGREIAEKATDVIRMVIFYDMATVLRDWEDYSSQQWRTGIGFGFRLNPLGFPVPFALDFGWALKREDTDDRELISVTFDVRF